MDEVGLRERKKARTRRLIADTAARLFAERGYEHVAVLDVAREAEVSEQTVYNHFRTKEHLVIDRDQHMNDQMGTLIRARAAGVSPAAAVREFVLASVDGICTIPDDVWRGELGHLAAISPAVRRLALETVDRQAVTIAEAISDTTSAPAELAKLYGVALAGVVRIIIDEAGRRTLAGQSQATIARELRPMIENVLDQLDEWMIRVLR